jgi:hypothetical protein
VAKVSVLEKQGQQQQQQQQRQENADSESKWNASTGRILSQQQRSESKMLRLSIFLHEF